MKSLKWNSKLKIRWLFQSEIVTSPRAVRGFNLTPLEIGKLKRQSLFFIFSINIDSGYHNNPSNSSSFSIEKTTYIKLRKMAHILSTNMIVVSVFLSISEEMEFHLVQYQKENCDHANIPFNFKGNGNFFVWV